MIPRLFFPRLEPAAPVPQPSGLPEKEVGGNECATGEWARTRRELANCHGEQACERAHWAAAGTGSTRGPRQRAAAAASRAGARHSAVGSLASSARLPCPALPRASVAVRLPACLGPLLFAISRLTQCPTPTRRLLLCFVPFFILFLKNCLFCLSAPQALASFAFTRFLFPFPLSSFSISFFLSLLVVFRWLWQEEPRKRPSRTRTLCAETEEEALWPLINGVRSHGAARRPRSSQTRIAYSPRGLPCLRRAFRCHFYRAAVPDAAAQRQSGRLTSYQGGMSFDPFLHAT